MEFWLVVTGLHIILKFKVKIKFLLDIFLALSKMPTIICAQAYDNLWSSIGIGRGVRREPIGFHPNHPASISKQSLGGLYIFFYKPRTWYCALSRFSNSRLGTLNFQVCVLSASLLRLHALPYGILAFELVQGDSNQRFCRLRRTPYPPTAPSLPFD